MKALVIAAFLAAGACDVHAADLPTRELISRAKGEADAILAKAHLQAEFENVTTTGAPAIRHKASQVTCLFDLDDVEHHVSLTNGNVYCGKRTKDGWVKAISAIELPTVPSLDEIYGPSVADFQNQLSDGAVLADDQYLEMTANSASGAPLRWIGRTAHFKVSTDGIPCFARRQVGVVGRWVLLVDALAPLSGPEAMKPVEIDLVAQLDALTSVRDMGPMTNASR